MLRVVAIENSKDADQAALAVLSEIIPYFSLHSIGPSNLPENDNGIFYLKTFPLHNFQDCDLVDCCNYFMSRIIHVSLYVASALDCAWVFLCTSVYFFSYFLMHTVE